MSSNLRCSMSTPKYLLSIDPARFAGWALFVDGKLTRYGEADGSMWRTFSQALAPLHEFLPEIQALPPVASQCVIEEGWSRGGKGDQTLSRRRGIAQAAAESYGFQKFTYLHSATWQNGLY